MRNFLKVKSALPLIALMIVMGVVSSAKADNLVIGGTIGNPTNILFPVGSTFLASTSQNVNGTNPNGIAFQGVMRAAVYRSSTGTMDFYYQYTATAGPSNADRLTFFDFDGFLTDVFEVQASFNAGAVAFQNGQQEAGACDRGTGDLGCDYGSAQLAPGQTTFTVLIRTNATNFAPGSFSVIDGGVASISAYQPTNVPEPASMLLLGSGLVGLAGAARRKFKKS